MFVLQKSVQLLQKCFKPGQQTKQCFKEFHSKLNPPSAAVSTSSYQFESSIKILLQDLITTSIYSSSLDKKLQGCHLLLLARMLVYSCNSSPTPFTCLHPWDLPLFSPLHSGFFFFFFFHSRPLSRSPRKLRAWKRLQETLLTVKYRARTFRSVPGEVCWPFSYRLLKESDL